MPSKPSSEPFIWIKDTDTARNSSRPVSSTHISISKNLERRIQFQVPTHRMGTKTQSRYRICTDRDHRRPRQQPRIPIASPARRYIRWDRNRILQKESQQNAARIALNRIRRDKNYQQSVLATQENGNNTIVT